MKTENKIQYLTYLDVRIYDQHLMLIEAKGYSEHERPGVPKLVPAHQIGNYSEEGILELDFINQPVGDSKKEKVTFDIKIVIDLGKLPDNLMGVKVIAEENADIILI
ncbi:MAG: hypothetical protein DRJ02_08155 [Bacteroidetes bacterium]|nr:MAG: hypothetical protein DRJ02_08155 [Bacteroidota bacterium]